jgi:hypothetical protein
VFVQWLPVPGFQGHPAKTQGKNIIVFVRGSRHPSQAVVVGSHYDGNPSSRGSAYDDTSGSTVILGLAHSLGAYWRMHGLPRRTVEFIIFDAEEQGVVGSSAYLWYHQHAAIMPHPTMMIDEEQTGVQYPARPFGLASDPVMPAYDITTAQGALIERLFHPLKKWAPVAQRLMKARLVKDRASAFHQLHTVYPTITMRDGTVAAFTPADMKHVVIGPTPVCCSDNAPFEALALPTVTFSGDFQFYNQGHPDWAFPYDQPSDTPTTLACDTGGSPKPSRALEAALDEPLVMSYDLVNQYAPASADYAKTFTVMTSRVVARSESEFAASGPGPITWSFGDGGQAHGATVTHRYAAPGSYAVGVHSPMANASRTVKVYSTHVLPHGWTNVPKTPQTRGFHPTELNGIPGCS